MEPKDIDKLFGERLKNAHPTPPADLWNRLQQRIETEMPATPQQELVETREEKPVIAMWSKRYYSIAAAVTLLLVASLAYFGLRQDLAPGNQTIARHDAATTEIAAETPAEKAIAATTPEVKIPEASGEASNVPAPAPETQAAPATKPSATARMLANASTKAASKQDQQQAPELAQQHTMQALATTTPAVEPAIPATDLDVSTGLAFTPAVLASAQPVQPVEIVIKRASGQQMAEDEDDELSGFEKKQRLARGIFRQARNLSNGEPIDFTDIGINANRIALETQIGKHKISKVINL